MSDGDAVFTIARDIGTGVTRVAEGYGVAGRSGPFMGVSLRKATTRRSRAVRRETDSLTNRHPLLPADAQGRDAVAGIGHRFLDSLILSRIVGRGLLVIGSGLLLSGLLGCGLVLGGLGRLIGRLVGRRLLGGLLLGGRGLLGLDLDLQTVGHRLGGNGVDAGRVGGKLGLGVVGRDLLDRLYGKAALGGDAKLELLIGRGLHGFVGGGVGVRPNGKCALGEREGNGCGGVRRGRYRRLAILRSAPLRYVF